MDLFLVTGASGFIGAHLVRRLALEGKHVVGTCTDPARAWRLRGLPPNFTLAVADLRSPASLDALFAAHRFTTVFHLAARGVHGGSDDPAAVAAVNASGSLALAQAALRQGAVRSFVYCGSGLEYQSSEVPVDEAVPLGASSVYGASKSAGWLLLDYLRRAEGLPLTTVRPFTVFGPAESADKLIPYVIGRALRREPVHLTSGTQLRDYVYVSDVVDALILAARQASAAGSVFNIGAGPAGARTIRAVVEIVLERLGAPAFLCRYGSARRTRIDPPRLVANPFLAIRRLGWTPAVSLEQGLDKIIEGHLAEEKSFAAVSAA